MKDMIMRERGGGDVRHSKIETDTKRDKERRTQRERETRKETKT